MIARCTIDIDLDTIGDNPELLEGALKEEFKAAYNDLYLRITNNLIAKELEKCTKTTI